MSLLYYSSGRQPALVKEYHIQMDAGLELESGATLHRPVIAFQTWGTPDPDRSNVVWVCHALTGNHRVQEWWDGLFGGGKCFDPENYFIVCVNVPGSCYGTEGPLSFRPDRSEERYFRSFPPITVRDMVRVLDHVRKYLCIERIAVLIGASLGGQQALEWAAGQPHLFERVIPIATNVQHSPYGIAFNEAQRLAIAADPTFEAEEFCGGRNGLIAARSIAMLSYRTYEGYALTQTESAADKTDAFKAATYQRYQGEKLASRFNAYSYWTLSKAMDSHNLARGRRPAAEILAELRIPALVVGIDSDVLFPLHEQRFIADHLPDATLAVLTSHFGHDGFLVEFDQLAAVIRNFLDRTGSITPNAKNFQLHNSKTFNNPKCLKNCF
jgi:homoserine O-acetyltransferase/O-succinyltransferase